jgi:hypothetical protein
MFNFPFGNVKPIAKPRIGVVTQPLAIVLSTETTHSPSILCNHFFQADSQVKNLSGYTTIDPRVVHRVDSVASNFM